MYNIDDPTEIYETFWKDLVENLDGTINKDRLIRELSDYYWLLGSVSLVYDHVTGGKISKPNTLPETVIVEADGYMRKLFDEGLEELGRIREEDLQIEVEMMDK